jgi:UDP-N-acetylmuramoylalanine-D-glutamate ligase
MTTRLIAELVKEKVKAIVCMGVDNKKIIEAFKDTVPVIVETDSCKKSSECFLQTGCQRRCGVTKPGLRKF